MLSPAPEKGVVELSESLYRTQTTLEGKTNLVQIPLRRTHRLGPIEGHSDLFDIEESTSSKTQRTMQWLTSRVNKCHLIDLPEDSVSWFKRSDVIESLQVLQDQIVRQSKKDTEEYETRQIITFIKELPAERQQNWLETMAKGYPLKEELMSEFVHHDVFISNNSHLFDNHQADQVRLRQRYSNAIEEFDRLRFTVTRVEKGIPTGKSVSKKRSLRHDEVINIISKEMSSVPLHSIAQQKPLEWSGFSIEEPVTGITACIEIQKVDKAWVEANANGSTWRHHAVMSLITGTRQEALL